MTELDFLPAPLNSRFQTYASPVTAPGKCAVCGAVDRPVVDFGMSVQFYGAVMFCITCITEAAVVIGMVPNSKLLAAEESLTQSFTEQLNKRELVAISRERYCTIIMAISGLSDLILSASVSGDDTLAAEAAPEQPSLFDDVANTVFRSDGIVEQKHDAPVGKGRNSVSGSSSDGKFDL